MENYFTILVGFCLALSNSRYYVRLEVRPLSQGGAFVWLGFICSSQLARFSKERFNLVIMSRQRGTPRRASSGRGKGQCGCKVQVTADYENHISPRVHILVEDWEARVLNQKLATGQGEGQVNHYWLTKNMLCNLVEDMLSNWSDARDSVHAMKTRMAEIDSQLTTMDNSFAWKGTVGITSHGSLGGGNHDLRGGGSVSTTGGVVHVGCGRGGSGSVTGCTITAPQAPPFPIPSTMEPLFKRLKNMISQKPEQQQQLPQPTPEATTNSSSPSQEERWACPIIEEITPS